MSERLPKLIYGDDNGECTLYDCTKAELHALYEQLDEVDTDAIGGEQETDRLEALIESHKIPVPAGLEDGYVPDYVVYLAQLYDIEVESN